MQLEEILGKAMEFPFFIFVILVLSRRRFSARATVMITACASLPYMLAVYGVIRHWHYVIYAYPALDLTYRVINLLLMALAALGLTRQRLVQSLFIMASAYVVITVMDVLAVAGLLAAGIPALASKGSLYLLISLLIYRARKPCIGILNQTKKGWWLLCSVPLLLIACFLLITSIPATLSHNPAAMQAGLLLCGTTVIIYITFFYMMWEMHQQHQLAQNVIALRLSVSALEHQNELIQQNERQYRLFKHDLRHFIRMMSDCLARGDIGSLRELLSSLNAEAESGGGAMRVFTGNRLPDAILSRYAALAEAEGIDITIRIEPPEASAADATELAVVLANALENAVNACRRVPEGRARIVQLDGRKRGDQYFLEIANTYDGALTLDPDTGLPVGGGGRRGLGCQSIAFFAQKYNAALQFHAEDGWFRLRMLI